MFDHDSRYDLIVLGGSGLDLDVVGMRPEIDLRRRNAENDLDYRMRLIAKIRWLHGENSSATLGSMDEFLRYNDLLRNGKQIEIDGLPYFVVGVDFETKYGRGTVNFMPCVPAEFVPGLSTHEHRGPVYGTETTAPADKRRPNHVRDAVEANR